MGFILEKYSENTAGLVVNFRQQENSDTFCDTDSVNEALEYFGLYKDESGNLKIKDANEQAMGELGIEPAEADEFRSALDEITAAMTDEEALENKVLFKLWKVGVEYQKDKKGALWGQPVSVRSGAHLPGGLDAARHTGTLEVVLNGRIPRVGAAFGCA